jgi:hypothetical protein
MKFNKYQTTYEIINAVHSKVDIEELREFIAKANPADDPVVAGHLKACKEALRVYDQGLFRRWSTPFLQAMLEECSEIRYKAIYEAELHQRNI